MAAPPPQQMVSKALLTAATQVPGYIMKQKNSECCRFLCCQPNMEFTTHDYREELKPNEQLETRYTVLETASYCGRTCSFCAPGSRSTTYRMYPGQINVSGDAGAVFGSPIVMSHEKEGTFGADCLLCCSNDGNIRVPCCCNLPYLTTKDGEGNVLGVTRYVCNICCLVPRFSVENPQGARMYELSPDTCCLGCCVRPRCGGGGAKCCRVPFIIRHPVTSQPVDDGKIVDLWAGLAREACTRQNMYQIKFPASADQAMRATLLGAALLVDLVVFEQNA